MEFEQLNVSCDKNPIVLIDNSGSTKDQMNGCSILHTELQKMRDMMDQLDITEIYLMFWNSNCEFANNKKLINIKSIDESNYKSYGSTYLGTALKQLPVEWFENKEKCDIYIYTDGEINDAPHDIMREILNKASIHIITVEANNNNYNNINCNAGNTIYDVIRKNCLTGKVKQFVSFNKHHIYEPFVTFNNPDVPHGYASFRNQIFKITNMKHFINYMDTLISQTNENDIMKLTHDLSLTVSHLIKNKSIQIQHQIINLFADLFSNTYGFKLIRELLLKEVDNHVKGTATTFQAYKRNREKVFENAQISLYQDVKQSISYVPSKKYLSLIQKTTENKDVIIIASANNVKERIILANKIFNNGGFNIDKYNIPMLPLDVALDHDTYDQCMRQWIRANYSKKYNINAASDIILYYFFADAMRVFLSDLSIEIKNSYRELVKLMLDRKRYGTDITEYNYLQDNPPAAVTGSASKINYILYKTMKFCGLVKENINILNDIQDDDENNINDFTAELIIKPFTFWYAFILSFGDELLIKSQYIFCEQSLKDDNMDNRQLIDFMHSHLVKINEIDCTNVSNYDYTCYITLEHTDKTGGYILPPHRLSKNSICSPNMIISSDAYNSIKLTNYNTCPICYSELNFNDFKWIKPKNEILQEESLKNSAKMPNLNEPYYNINSFDVVEIDETVYKSDNDLSIYKMNDCNFDTVAYTINCPYIQEALGTRSIEVKTQEEFNKIVYFKYPFLKEINFKNVVIAGGFCRSILLRQKMKDFDFFIHDENNDHMNIFNRLLTDTLVSIKKQHPDIKFLSMYKHLFNVYEVVCVLDPNNFFRENYTLDNFDKFKFNSLHLYDHHTIIDPENGKVYRRRITSKCEILNEDELNELIKNKDFSNYFEDGDINGVRMIYRLQFILTKNKNIENILDGFDLYPSRVAFDGSTTYFTKKSEQAYKYMINVINENNYSTLFDHRISKYFTYGFSIVLPELNIETIENNQVLSLGTNHFDIKHILNNCIMVEHNSHLLRQIQSIEALEKQNLENGKSLYKSSLFCSLVSLLRYIKINNVSYLFTTTPISPGENGSMKFQESNEVVQFIDKIESRIPNNDFYGKYRNNFNDVVLNNGSLSNSNGNLISSSKKSSVSNLNNTVLNLDNSGSDDSSSDDSSSDDSSSDNSSSDNDSGSDNLSSDNDSGLDDSD